MGLCFCLIIKTKPKILKKIKQKQKQKKQKRIWEIHRWRMGTNLGFRCPKWWIFAQTNIGIDNNGWTMGFWKFGPIEKNDGGFEGSFQDMIEYRVCVQWNALLSNKKQKNYQIAISTSDSLYLYKDAIKMQPLTVKINDPFQCVRKQSIWKSFHKSAKNFPYETYQRCKKWNKEI